MADFFAQYPLESVGGGGGGSGTVTSVALAAPASILSVSGSPVTTAGTLTLGLVNQAANRVWAGPATGSAAAPTFRALVAADLPLTFGDLTDAGTDGITITGGTGAVIGSGTSISQHIADSTHNGYLSSTDWTTFNSKQAAGDYITELTGDGAASGPGSAVLTLATVNSDVGTFGSASQSVVFTVNGKGLTTATNDVNIQIAESQVTNLVSDLAGKEPTITVLPANKGGTGVANNVASTLTISGSFATTLTVTNTTSITLPTSGTVPGITPTNHGVIVSGAGAAANVTATGTSGQLLTSNGASADPTFQSVPGNTTVLKAPTIQKFTSSTGTYTTPTTPVPLYLRVRMVGGGGGGAGGGTGSQGTGGNGVATTFGTTLLSAGGGTGAGGGTAAGGLGGTSSLGSGPIGTALQGGQGGSAYGNLALLLSIAGGIGGTSIFGGAGAGGPTSTTGFAGTANTGAGGGGAGTGPTTGNTCGAGGGSGGAVDALISAPTTTYAYVVGSGGAGGTAGSSGFAGGTGASGYIEVTEYYQ